MEEIVVTAPKLNVPAREVSGSVTVLSGTQLEAAGAEELADYLANTTGVVFNASTPGNSPVTIRGVATTTGLDQGQGTTGYFINQVPLSDPYYTIGIPDIDAFDVGGVTVLRGPQGTLFGAASLGGAINYQAAEPNLHRLEAHFQSTAEDSAYSSDFGGSGKIMLNAPLITDRLAVRGVFVYKKNRGVFDNLGTGEKDANRTLVRSGRAQVKWQPTDATTVSYLYLDQTEDTHDLGYSQPADGGQYGKGSLFPEFANYRTRINNLRLDQDAGFANINVTATHHEKMAGTASDLSSFLAPLFGGAGGPYADGGPSESRGTTFELRLSSYPGARIDYVVGLYHDRTAEDVEEYLLAYDHAGVVAAANAIYGPLFGNPTVGSSNIVAGRIFDSHTNTVGRENAAFGEVTFHFNSAWKATLGGRYFDTKLSNTSISNGFFQLLTVGTPTALAEGASENRGFTPKTSLTWTPSGDLMLYGLVDKGFRFGGPNINPPDPLFKTPGSYKSDSLINYELGARTNWWDGRLQWDATAFYIDWSDIQLRLTTPSGFLYAANAGKATNYGSEMTTALLITPSFRIVNNITYLSATLARDFPLTAATTIPAGTTLPGASKWQESTEVSYKLNELPMQPVVLVSQRYISTAPGIFGQNVTQGNYSLYGARATLHFRELQLSAFIDNIANARGVITATSTALGGFRQYLVNPRTIGITIDFKL